MALPAIAGIPWLASFLGGLFVSLVAWFAKYMTWRLALVVAAVVAIVAAFTAMIAVITSAVGTLTMAMPTQLANGLYLFLPANAVPCLAVIYTARITRWLYDWKLHVIELKLYG